MLSSKVPLIVARFSTVTGVGRSSAQSRWAVKIADLQAETCVVGGPTCEPHLEGSTDQMRPGAIALLIVWAGCIVSSFTTLFDRQIDVVCVPYIMSAIFRLSSSLGYSAVCLTAARLSTRFYGDVTFIDNSLLSISNDGGTVR